MALYWLYGSMGDNGDLGEPVSETDLRSVKPRKTQVVDGKKVVIQEGTWGQLKLCRSRVVD
jgi:hypothetical protein